MKPRHSISLNQILSVSICLSSTQENLCPGGSTTSLVFLRIGRMPLQRNLVERDALLVCQQLRVNCLSISYFSVRVPELIYDLICWFSNRTWSVWVKIMLSAHWTSWYRESNWYPLSLKVLKVLWAWAFADLRCAMATLRLGYEVFAIRQMGVCATSKDAHLYFRHLGDVHWIWIWWNLVEQCWTHGNESRKHVSILTPWLEQLQHWWGLRVPLHPAPRARAVHVTIRSTGAKLRIFFWRASYLYLDLDLIPQ